MAGMGNMALEGADARITSEAPSTYTRPQNRKPHDSSVTFDEYFYYAKLAREEEDHLADKDIGDSGIMSLILPSKSAKGHVVQPTPSAVDEKTSGEKTPPTGNGMHDMSHSDRMHVSDAEWANASRAIRTATWAAIFYLITTDILGPFGVPFAMGTLGWGPGIALYTVFGGLAVYGGFLLYHMFLGLDSYHYPMKTYGDIAFRIFGSPARHGLNFLQSIQLLCNVGAIIIGNGQALSQVSKFKLCYAVCCLVFALCGFVIGQIRTLQKYGWVANAAIWMRKSLLYVFVIIVTMGVAAHSDPNYIAAQGASAGAALGGLSVTPDDAGNYPPIVHTAGLPFDTDGFVGSINGLMQAVYAYGGAMLFVEFMAEMKRPRDFWKGMIFAQLFIYVVYIFYGCFLYGYQGQYAVNPSYQSISPYGWQTTGNVISFISALIAAGLYGNIGIKVLYNNILIDFFNAPPLTVKAGKILWAAVVPVYWTLAFIIAASIPNFFGFTSLVAALCILQFTYTFPPILYLGYQIKIGAMLEGEGFNPTTGVVTKHDSGPKRWMRGFMKNKWYNNVWLIVYFLGSLVTAALGAYSAITSLIHAFEKPQITAFTCHSPLDG